MFLAVKAPQAKTIVSRGRTSERFASVDHSRCRITEPSEQTRVET